MMVLITAIPKVVRLRQSLAHILSITLGRSTQAAHAVGISLTERMPLCQFIPAGRHKLMGNYPSPCINSATTLPIRSLGALALFGCVAWPAAAQDAISPTFEAGAIQRQADETRPTLNGEGQREAADIALPPLPQAILDDSEATPGAPTLLLRAWEFSGNTIFDTETLRQVLASVTGRELTISQLYSAAQAIEAHYAVAGYVAQATLPPQEVVNGIVRIEILEAAYAGVEFEGEPPARIRPEVIRKVFDAHAATGEPLRLAEFDLPNLLVNDLPGVAVAGAFAPGRNPGETVLLLNTFDAPLAFGQVLVDNSGSRATGTARALGQVAFNSPLGYGDLLRADLAKTEGSQSFSGSYSLPLGAKGMRLTLNGNVLSYDVITPEMRDLDVSGTSLTRGFSISFPFRRSRDLNVTFDLSNSVADLENSVRGDVVSDYRVGSSSIGLSGNWRDQVGGTALTSFGVSFASGSAKGTGSSGAFGNNFDVFRLNVEREQYLTESTALLLGFSGQYGSRGLDSSEQFSLGGPNAVRAYPVGEAGGPRGAILNVELRHQFAEQWRVTGFYDYGVVSGRNAPNEPSSYSLKGLGATVSWAGLDGWGADLTWARRIGSNPNPIIDVNRGPLGNDQDGSLDENRFWFALRKTF